jgi:hypothetical protein
VTLKWRTRRRSCARTTKTKRTSNQTVGTVKHRSQLRHVIVEKGSPGLRWRTRNAHLVGDSRLGYFDAQLQQFTVDSRCSPEWIGPTHLLDYLSRLSVDLRSTESRTALPSPAQSKAFTMPSHNSSGLHNDETRSPIRPEPRQGDPEPAVRPAQFGTCRKLGFQDGKLMPKSDDFQMQSGPGLEPQESE